MKSNQLKAGVYLSYISLFTSNITNLVLTPFIIKNLGQSEYGLYMLIGALVGYIAILDFGLGNTTVRFVAKYRAENDKSGQENFLFITSVIYGIISIIVIIIGSILYLNLDNIFQSSLTIREIEIAKVMFIILVINLAFTLPLNSYKGIITAYEQFIFPKVLSIVRILVRAAAILLLLLLGYKAIAIVLVDAILNFIMLMIYTLYVYKKLNVRVRCHNFNKDIIKEIFSYTSLIFISVVVDQFYWRIGHLILGLVASTSSVAIFAIGMTFGQYFITFSTAISGVFLPKITKMVVNNSSNKEMTDLFIKTGRIQFLVLGLILGGFTLFGEKFIFLWAGPGYEVSWKIAMMVMIPLFIVLCQTIGISILQAKNMHGFRAYSYLFISLLNIIISFFMAKVYGAVGAALGTTLSLILGNIIIMNLYYNFKVKLNMVRFYKELFKGLLLSFLLSLLLGLLLKIFLPISTWSILFLQFVIYMIIYITVFWLIGMNNYEKALFSKELNKFKKVFFN